MAIKINNTVVIDDGRGISGTGLTVTSISASGSVGSAGSVLTSTGSAIYWSNGATVVGGATTYFFSSTGTFTKPSVGTFALVRIWGGGGSGSKSPNSAGGGGGACVEQIYRLNQIPPSVTVTIAAGGASTTTAGAPGLPGGQTIFAPGITSISVSAYGGGGGYIAPGPSGLSGGGGGGGSLGRGDPARGAPFLVPGALAGVGGSGYVNGAAFLVLLPGSSPEMIKLSNSHDGGASAAGPFTTPSTTPISGYTTKYGGASGGALPATPFNHGHPTIYGGAGGFGNSVTPGGSTVYGGAAGVTTGGTGSARGGGGPGVPPTSPGSGAGGPGFCEIWVW